MGFKCVYFRGLFLPPWRESKSTRLSKGSIWMLNNYVCHLHFKVTADKAQGLKEKLE